MFTALGFLSRNQHCPVLSWFCWTHQWCWLGQGSSDLQPWPCSSLQAGMLGHPLYPAAFILSRSLLDLQGREPLATPRGV